MAWEVRGWARVTGLTVLAAGLPAVEAGALHRAGIASVIGIVPHSTAPPPFGAYHDLRWLAVYHSSWLTLAGGLAGLVVFRTLLNTALVALAWPPGVPRPAVGRLLAAGALYTALVAVVFAPSVLLTFMGAVTSLSLFVLCAVLLAALLAAVMNRGGMVPGWWRYPPTLRTVGLALLTFVVLTAYSAAVRSTPGWWAVAVAFTGGMVNAVLWVWLARIVARAPSPVRRSFVTPLAIAVIPVLVLVAGSQVVVRLQPDSAPRAQPDVDGPAPDGGQPVLVLLGYGSAYPPEEPLTGYPDRLDLTYFSYRGQSAGGVPLPYGPHATHQSLDRLARMLGRQVDTLHRRTGRRISILARSEGALIARTYLADHREAPVDTLVELSPLVRPARVYYPPRDAETGWGIGTGWALRLFAAALRLTTESTAGVDEPFVRSVLDRGPFYRNIMMCPAPGTEVIVLLPLESAAAAPSGHLSDITTMEFSGLHGSLADSEEVRRQIVDAFTGRPVRPAESVVYQAARRAASGWQVPPLPLSFVSSWKPAGVFDAALEATGACVSR